MNQEAIGKVREKKTVDFNAGGLGRMRPTGEIIVLLMSLEDYDQAGILADVAQRLGISLEEFTEAYTNEMCGRCGMGTKHHNKELSDGQNCVYR